MPMILTQEVFEHRRAAGIGHDYSNKPTTDAAHLQSPSFADKFRGGDTPIHQL